MGKNRGKSLLNLNLTADFGHTFPQVLPITLATFEAKKQSTR
jgi:hypothetical protein